MSADLSLPWTNPRACHTLRLQNCSIVSIASRLPDRALTNADLGKQLGLEPERIFARTGIRERRLAAANEFTSDLAAQAALSALSKANLSAKDVDLIIVATSTPDMIFPATACVVQEKIGAGRCPSFDLKAGSTGFLYALQIGAQFVSSRTFQTVLVIGAEKLSTILDERDSATSVLFGDGAGAAILQHRPSCAGLRATSLGSDGAYGDFLSMPGGGSRVPATQDSVERRLHFLRMRGKQMFKQAVLAMCRAVAEVLNRCDLSISRIKRIIPHQTNQSLIDAFTERIGAAPGQVFRNLETVGDTSAASIPIALAEAEEMGHLQRGDLVLLVAFGSGLTWGATVLEW